MELEVKLKVLISYQVVVEEVYIVIELLEYQESKSMEELADLLEVIHAVALARGSSIGEVEQIRIQKAEKRGGFEKRILLKSVTEA